jgi:plasmid maintenance system killer protein
MPIDRRCFLQVGICSAVLLPFSRLRALQAQSISPETEKVSAEAACAPTAFTIYGWDCLDSKEPLNENQFCFRVNQSWRTVWR